MQLFTKESIDEAIKLIDQNPDLLKRRESKDYDILSDNGNRYPPILVLSEANKILGGETLVINDFNNSTRRPFNILKTLGFNVVAKDIHLQPSLPFEYKRFLDACQEANLYVSEQLAIRFMSSLLAKPFVILTGLSGSGKTKLALAFAKWITSDTKFSSSNTFSIGEEVKSNRVSYVVNAADKIAVTFVQPESGTKATFPYELINEWIAAIKENEYTQDTKPREIREKVEQTTKYSAQLNSFETHLKAAAFHLISKNESTIKATPYNGVCIVPVGADWTNREPILGYPNALESGKYVVPENGALQLIIDALNDPENPYFLILDEMNLSHVERYLADFLSAMESSEDIPLHSDTGEWKDSIPAKVKLPQNLFIIGTVNIDETTYMFSPKVLDRANVIEFRVSEAEMKEYLHNNKTLDLNLLKSNGASMAKSFVQIATRKNAVPDKADEMNEALIAFFSELKKSGAEFGYRSAAEIIRFAGVVNDIEPDWSMTKIIDAAIMQKLLPKVHGSRRKLEPVLNTLGKLCLQDNQKIEDFISPKSDINFDDTGIIKYPLSLEKILRMRSNLIGNGFTSYAEA